MRLVDTNVLIGLFIRELPWHGAARNLHATDPVWYAESHALVEISSVLTKYVRAKEISIAAASSTMAHIENQMSERIVIVEHASAIRLAIQYGVSAYDARMLFAAIELQLPLITEDRKLRAQAPRLTMDTAQALASGNAR